MPTGGPEGKPFYVNGPHDDARKIIGQWLNPTTGSEDPGDGQAAQGRERITRGRTMPKMQSNIRLYLRKPASCYDAIVHGYDEVSPLEPEEWEFLTPVW